MNMILDSLTPASRQDGIPNARFHADNGQFFLGQGNPVAVSTLPSWKQRYSGRILAKHRLSRLVPDAARILTERSKI
jgi:hypothetical protein